MNVEISDRLDALSQALNDIAEAVESCPDKTKDEDRIAALIHVVSHAIDTGTTQQLGIAVAEYTRHQAAKKRRIVESN